MLESCLGFVATVVAADSESQRYGYEARDW